VFVSGWLKLWVVTTLLTLKLLLLAIIFGAVIVAVRRYRAKKRPGD